MSCLMHSSIMDLLSIRQISPLLVTFFLRKTYIFFEWGLFTMVKKLSLSAIFLFLLVLATLSTFAYAVSKEKVIFLDLLSTDNQEKHDEAIQQIQNYQTLDPEVALSERIEQLKNEKVIVTTPLSDL